MRFQRVHGLGNDYLLLVTGQPLTPELVRAICDRHTGIGSDGVLEPVAGPDGMPGLRIHNPDGSQAEKSGNGLRIFAHWYARGGSADVAVWTLGGVVHCSVRGDRVRVEMGRAKVGEVRSVGGYPFLPVDVGNPHHVCFSACPDWERLAPVVEVSVPDRTNVQLASVLAPHRVSVRIWERGAGETRSSGSSACAVAAAGVATGRLRSPITVDMPGGTLLVEVNEALDLTMEGPVEPIATILVDPTWLHRRIGATTASP